MGNRSKIASRMIRFSLRTLALVTSSCPLIGFVLCVLISIWKDFYGVNHTHCNVYNFLPSISASIGNFTPQRYIWRIAVALHVTPRILFAVLWYTWHRQDLHNWSSNPSYRTLCRVNLGFCLMELSCLVGLTYVSSNDDYSIHEKCFIFFVIFAVLHMISTCCLCHKRKAPMHQYSYQYKLYLFGTFVASIISFSYLFDRHNRYCEPYVYSVFAFFEYLCVVSNIAFHTTIILDVRDHAVIITNSQVDEDVLNGYLAY
ncbi:post-GPI attachment to proteins factor 2-like [Acanthaster planci]|uniref:Post-GPI attachment to proteins factor 2-like n=1 Tax=Acanthaster planci TaxID=133434 RepID=A0A8B7ZIJ8_ACAPL|nr:post-GPI attachment to proteins factor 2-like [Acanthaster planci]